MRMLLFYCLFFSFLSLFTSITFADSKWQCYAADKGGHRWASPGLTEENAAAVALTFCKAFSPHASSCHHTECAIQE